MKLKVKGPWTQFVQPMRDLVPFTTHGSLKGVKVDNANQVTLGQLDQSWWAPATNRSSPFYADYVIYSYTTPIAWHIKGTGWIMPSTTYSITTTIQQGRIGTALSVLDNAAY